MGSDVKVKVVHKEAVRPSSPTPHHLKFLGFSIFDQLAPAAYIPLVLFYPNNSDHHEVNNVDHQHSLVGDRTKLLKTSLSETLTRFYPFAGIFLDNHASVCCNDQGVMFLEAQVTCSISRILDKPDVEVLKNLIPLGATKGDTDYVLLVQVNFFECGGIAIGFNASHKIIDAYTLSTFINSWAAISRSFSTSDNGVVVHQHQYVSSASVFPTLDFSSSPPPSMEFAIEKCTTRRFRFESSKISCLRSEAVSAAVQNPTRVEAVSALLWKCAMQASRSNTDCPRPSSVWCQVVNMRKVLAQPSAENLMGNLVGFFLTKSTAAEGDDDLPGLVAKMRKGFEEFKEKYGTKDVSVDDICDLLTEYVSLMHKDDIECYNPTSWCRLPFYEANFGWGRPLMSVPATEELKNLILLMDTSDGDGIEARLTLKEEDMAIFENNDELLAYAHVDPSII